MGGYELREGALLFSTDQARLDTGLIHKFLSEQSYWVPNIRRDLVEKAITHSMCFGVYENAAQIGFARVVTDYVGFAWLADVFVVPNHRGRGISRRLMRFVLDHPDLQTLRRFMLATRDAHGLYRQFGFVPLAKPERYLERYDPDALSRGG